MTFRRSRLPLAAKAGRHFVRQAASLGFVRRTPALLAYARACRAAKAGANALAHEGFIARPASRPPGGSWRNHGDFLGPTAPLASPPLQGPYRLVLRLGPQPCWADHRSAAPRLLKCRPAPPTSGNFAACEQEVAFQVQPRSPLPLTSLPWRWPGTLGWDCAMATASRRCQRCV